MTHINSITENNDRRTTLTEFSNEFTRRERRFLARFMDIFGVWFVDGNSWEAPHKPCFELPNLLIAYLDGDSFGPGDRTHCHIEDNYAFSPRFRRVATALCHRLVQRYTECEIAMLMVLVEKEFNPTTNAAEWDYPDLYERFFDRRQRRFEAWCKRREREALAKYDMFEEPELIVAN